MPKFDNPHDALRYHVTGAVERGEGQAIVEVKAIKLAHWVSKGARWEAILDRLADGWRLSERKHGQEVGACFRPLAYFINDNEAKEYFQNFVATSFDVAMKRVA